MNARRYVVGLGALAITLSAVTASAGIKWVENVYLGSNYAYGSVGSARVSSDRFQNIGCYIEQTSGGSESLTGGCYANDSNGNSRSCYFPQAAIAGFAKVLATAVSNSEYDFSWDANGACNYLTVDNGSQWAPLSP
jgi:hypothetical protein